MNSGGSLLVVSCGIEERADAAELTNMRIVAVGKR